MIYITTADFDRPSICNEIYAYGSQVRDSVRKNPGFLPIIYEAPAVYHDEVVDYTDPKNYRSKRIWSMANPMLGVSVSRDYMESESLRAHDVPGYLPTFLQLHLNVRVKQTSQWINMSKWDNCAWKYGPEDLLGRTCYGGIDLGATSDLTSMCLIFPLEDGQCQALWWHWVCEEQVKQREYRGDVAYQAWVNEGMMRVTEGDEIDYASIRDEVIALTKEYNVIDLAADRLFQGAQLCQDLKKAAINVVEFGMGYYSMAAPTAELERIINRREFHHNGDQVSRWAAGNCVVRRDAAGNLKPDKEKSKDKIDPIVAALMALGRMMQRPEKKPSVYETRGLVQV
jgi:phage terminase large subunit-like protein